MRRLCGPGQALAYHRPALPAAALVDACKRVAPAVARPVVDLNGKRVVVTGAALGTTLADARWLMRINIWDVVHGCRARVVVAPTARGLVLMRVLVPDHDAGQATVERAWRTPRCDTLAP